MPRFALRLRILLLLLAGLLGVWAGVSDGEITINFDQFHQLMAERFGTRRVRVARAWEQMLNDIAPLPNSEKIEPVNQFFYKHLRYASDLNIWGVDDYWATPLETLGKGMGDCEDWAIAKYISLRAAGVSDSQLRLIYVSARISAAGRTVIEPHMVLGYYAHPAAEPLILDNLTRRVLPASERSDLTPVFSFNSEGLWVGHKPAPAGSSNTPLSRWRDLLERIRAEGGVFERTQSP